MANGENLGSINYSVDVDYSALIAAGQAQDQFTQKARDTASEMTKYKYVTSSVTKEYRSLKASIDPAYKAQQQFAAGADLIQKELNSGRITLSQYSKDMANLRATTRATAQVGGMFRSSFGGVGTIAQQAGYQIGDFATQVASGQSAMMAFTQQAPQFAGAFGPGGAVLGAVIAIGGAITGGLVRAFSEGEEGASQLSQSMEYLDEVMGRTESGAMGLTERIRDLAKESRAAAQIELQRGLVEAASAFNSARTSLYDAAEDALDTTILGDFDAAVSQAERLARMGVDVNDAFSEFATTGAQFREGINLIRDEAENLNDEFGISIGASRTLIGALGAVKADPTVAGFQALQQAIFEATKSSDNVTPAFMRTASEMSNLASQAVEAAKRGEQLEEWIANLDEALRESDPALLARQTALQNITTALEDEYLALTMSDRLLLQHRLNVVGATEAEQERALALYDAAEALRVKAQADEEARMATERAAKEAERRADAEEKAARRAAEAWESVRRSDWNDFQNLLDKIDPLGAKMRKLGEDIAVVQMAFGRGWIDEGQADEIVNALTEAAENGGQAFVNEWQKAADNVAQSLQDAIASGDWDKIGDAIGNSLATSIAGIVNKTITDSLAKDLTANSSALAQIGGAFAGPIAGAVAGGAIQLAMSELSDFFSGSDWDPTEARQAAQGTGTVLGSIDAKSESIAKAVDISAGASRELVGINRDMLRALQTLQLGIAGASGMVARSYGGLSMPADFTRTISGSDFDLTGGIMPIYDEALGAAFDFYDGAFDVFSFGTFDLGGALGSVFGGSTEVKDFGIQFFGATLDEMIRGWRDGDNYYTAQAYATIKRDGGWFGSDKRWDEYQRLGTDAENQISLVFMGIRDSVTAGAEALGMSSTEIQSALDGFQVETQKISLEGLSAEEQTAELEAVFSSIFDQAAGAVVPYLDDFQRAGEGLGETLARVATQVQVTEQAVDMLGLQFSDLAGAELIEASDRLIELNGGLDQFISNMQNFIGNFATEAQQFEINANTLAQGMGSLPLPETREGFWQLLQAQDASTAAGAENIATLLRLQGTADQYYSAIEKAQDEAQKAQEQYYATEISGQRSRLQEAQRANRAVQSAMDSMLFQSSAVQEASRQSAIRTLEQIANAGRVSDIGQLQSALDAATQLDQGRYSTFADYAREYARTAGVIGSVGDVTQTAEDREARMLRSLESQLEAIKGLRDDLERSQLAIIKQANKTAKTLERFEIDGIEVRA
jgi:hypothetical protein